MTYMLCHNHVSDFSKWKAVFDSHGDAHRNAGLVLRHIWRDVEDPNEIFFLFEVESIEKANGFIHSEESAKAGAEAGVIDGKYHYVEDVEVG